MAWLWLSLAIALSLLATGCSDGVLRLTFVTATPAVVAPTATPITDLNIAIDAQVVPTATAVIGPTPTVVPQGDPTPRSVVIIEAEPAPTDIPPPTLTPAPTIGIIAVVVPTPTVAPAFDPIVSVTIVPFDINVMVGMSLRLAATGANESGNEVTDATVSWSVSEDAGTVNSDGLFTASDTPGVYPDALTIDLLRKGVITSVTHTVTVNSGLVHLWSGDDDATDSVSGNNGVMNGATFAPGKVGRAFSFDGDDDYIALDQQPEIDNSFSIGGWVKFDEYRFNEGQEIFNNNQFFMRKDPDFRGHEMSLFIHLIGGGVEQRVSSITSLAPGVWYHVFGISDGSFIRIYLNGVLEAEERRGGALWPTPVEPRIGSGDGLDLSVNFFSGLIDELAIYKRALTGDEIASLFERGNSVTSTDGLVHLWSGDGNANDFVGGISGVPMNGATYAPGLFGDAFSLDGEDDFRGGLVCLNSAAGFYKWNRAL